MELHHGGVLLYLELFDELKDLVFLFLSIGEFLLDVWEVDNHGSLRVRLELSVHQVMKMLVLSKSILYFTQVSGNLDIIEIMDNRLCGLDLWLG